MKILLVTISVIFSANSYACKMSAVNYSKTVINAALNAFPVKNAQVQKILLGSEGYIDIRAISEGTSLRSVFKVTVNPDCTTIVANVKPGHD